MSTATVAQPATAEPDSYDLSKRLQDKGIFLTRIAVDVLGYTATTGYDSQTGRSTGESYLRSPYDEGHICVTAGSDGIEKAHAPFGLKGIYAFNAVDFMLAHNERLKNPRQAAEAICMAVFNQLDDTITAPKLVRIVAEQDQIQDMSLALQRQGVSLASIASDMFKFSVVRSGDETYIFTSGEPEDNSSVYDGVNTSRFVASVAANKDGLATAHYMEPVSGHTQACAVRFAMLHGNMRTPHEADKAIRTYFSKPALG